MPRSARPQITALRSAWSLVRARKRPHSPILACANAAGLLPSSQITLASMPLSSSATNRGSESITEILCASRAPSRERESSVAKCRPISPAPTIMMFMRTALGRSVILPVPREHASKIAGTGCYPLQVSSLRHKGHLICGAGRAFVFKIRLTKRSNSSSNPLPRRAGERPACHAVGLAARADITYQVSLQ